MMGLRPGEEFFGGTPKLPIGTGESPNFIDGIYQNEAPAIQTQNALVKLREIQKAPLQSIPQGEFNLEAKPVIEN